MSTPKADNSGFLGHVPRETLFMRYDLLMPVAAARKEAITAHGRSVFDPTCRVRVPPVCLCGERNFVIALFPET